MDRLRDKTRRKDRGRDRSPDETPPDSSPPSKKTTVLSFSLIILLSAAVGSGLTLLFKPAPNAANAEISSPSSLNLVHDKKPLRQSPNQSRPTLGDLFRHDA